jgi:hypothetical protein
MTLGLKDGRLAHKADSLTAICEPIVAVSSHCGPTRPVTGMAVYLPWKRHVMSSFLRLLLESGTCSVLNQKMVCSLGEQMYGDISQSCQRNRLTPLVTTPVEFQAGHTHDVVSKQYVTRLSNPNILSRQYKKNTPWSESAGELYRASDRRLSAK